MVLMNTNSFNVFLFRNMFAFVGFLLVVSISTLFHFFGKVLYRTQIYDLSQSNNPIEDKTEETKADDGIELKSEESEMFKEKESPKLVFKFQFQTQTFEEFSNNFTGDEDHNNDTESDPSTCTNKHPEDFSFCVKELYADSNNGLLKDEDIIEEITVLIPTENEKVTTMEDLDLKESDDSDDIMEETKQEGFNGTANSLEHNSNDSETSWEHQHLIEQLKMELKKVRTTGLPTIMEESESPKIMEDLKAWKIDEKLQHVDRMSELHKFYKTYTQKMRKFDIFNYQKMYALGFLQSKDPLQSISTHKSPAITSLLRQNLRLRRRKKCDFDPTTTRFIKELNIDLETVYVGQLCLSWEILHWQYEKAIEIWETDPYGLRRFNEVASEFQQFQVLIQRFIENEPFDGPSRVQNYLKNRCVLRNLLQVPVIREDCMKDKRKGRRKGRDDDDAITSDMLVEIMEESIRIFQRFVRADKDANVVIKNSRKGAQIEPLKQADLELLAKVQSSLQKELQDWFKCHHLQSFSTALIQTQACSGFVHTKDRKLKDILRSGNCILRKVKRNQEENSDQVLYFFSQVDLKLVARALNMSKVTKDQLFWCHDKLSRISFVHRKINVEPSFLLFPN